MDERVDILQPPLFTPTGVAKSRTQAYRDGDWTGAFNLWVVSSDPEPSILYQQRGPNVAWAPNMLDVTAAGQLLTGEELTDGLREVQEELGKRYAADQVLSLGKKLYVGFNADGTSRNNIIDIYMIEDNTPLSSYTLQEAEVHAVCKCPIKDLLQAHRNPDYTFTAQALTAHGEAIEIAVSRDSFPENWDNYHYKIALLMHRHFNGEKDIVY